MIYLYIIQIEGTSRVSSKKNSKRKKLKFLLKIASESHSRSDKWHSVELTRVQNPISLNTPFLIYFQRFSLSYYSTSSVSLSFSLPFGFFLFGFTVWFFISAFFISFRSSPSRGDYCFCYVDSVHLIYDFFVPQHKNENFFGFSYQSFVLFMFLLILFISFTVSLFLYCSHG